MLDYNFFTRKVKLLEVGICSDGHSTDSSSLINFLINLKKDSNFSSDDNKCPKYRHYIGNRHISTFRYDVDKKEIFNLDFVNYHILTVDLNCLFDHFYKNEYGGEYIKSNIFCNVNYIYDRDKFLKEYVSRYLIKDSINDGKLDCIVKK